MNIAELYKIYKQYPEVSTDTRNAPENSIFFALKGASFNGNEYAEKAIDNGCSYAVVDEEKYATRPNMLLVDDALATLQELARYHRKHMKTPVIGITGTNGKTTTKELITAVLSQEYNVLATEGNLNNHIGVPLTLLKLKKEHEIAVVEMGANHVGEIKFLSEIAQPNYGLITNIGRAHIEGFGSFENVMKAKGELYEYIRNSQDGKIFIDFDNSLLREMAEGIPSIYYGFEDELLVSGKVLSTSPYLEFAWKFADVENHNVVKTKLIGDYNLPNALAAIAVGKYLGVKASLICKAIEEYEPTNNRSQLKKTSKNMVIVDAYNANPTSMHAALENFEHMDVSHKVLILGDMKELGADSEMEHQKIADYIVSHNFDKVLLVGDNFSKIQADVLRFKDTNGLKDYLIANPLENSYILLKGSRGIQLENCIDLL
ncbi:UDP-N-acetylmuramoyl-tripeptide--D-alanyl-D-alanine ligase [Dysgonomonas sp. 511]|uniref:UDP-N-acetylmuramoyl-tripeptide--D-alanyl-D- alanine ligase n=1 Tax=Dysgonomonas sp. 511 TaxID=2302930 RepID=UPI0013D45046|nr:UDP-N-acetylmuramoyl-tripeptide--D-alanyl-D-alanine ligase [Dysgonomonas sp. 511]NDV79619.1 UDP-N-acetylmuramoyl-tripeptide--D-alanyl-D-alanine ligase [Dysgonomonas sp. 511]